MLPRAPVALHLEFSAHASPWGWHRPGLQVIARPQKWGVGSEGRKVKTRPPTPGPLGAVRTPPPGSEHELCAPPKGCAGGHLSQPFGGRRGGDTKACPRHPPRTSSSSKALRELQAWLGREWRAQGYQESPPGTSVRRCPPPPCSQSLGTLCEEGPGAAVSHTAGEHRPPCCLVSIPLTRPGGNAGASQRACACAAPARTTPHSHRDAAGSPSSWLGALGAQAWTRRRGRGHPALPSGRLGDAKGQGVF